jgi:hypothetical protein
MRGRGEVFADGSRWGGYFGYDGHGLVVRTFVEEHPQ